jgi:hypothetical protein
MDIPAIRENLNVITSLTQPGYPINSMGASLLLRNPLDVDVTVYLKDSADGTTFTNYFNVSSNTTPMLYSDSITYSKPCWDSSLITREMGSN